MSVYAEVLETSQSFIEYERRFRCDSATLMLGWWHPSIKQKEGNADGERIRNI